MAQALKTLVGQDADLQSKDPSLRPDKTLGCEASCLLAVCGKCVYAIGACQFRWPWSVQVFVAQMHGALRAAAPTLAEAAK